MDEGAGSEGMGSSLAFPAFKKNSLFFLAASTPPKPRDAGFIGVYPAC